VKLLDPVVVAPIVVALALASTAHAHPRVGALNTNAFDLSGALDREVAHVPTALELVVGGGYTQGAGGAGAAGDVQDVTGAGGGIELGVGARLSPGFGAGLYGTLARFQRGDAIGEGGRAHAATIGLQATWHARTARSLGPWVSLGAGWRALRLAPQDGPTSSVHGVEVVRLRLGMDYRFSRRLAITPALGASMTVFVAEGTAMTDLMSLQGNRVSVYAFTGVLGRFDLGG
jgi:hypothetical protein